MGTGWFFEKCLTKEKLENNCEELPNTAFKQAAGNTVGYLRPDTAPATQAVPAGLCNLSLFFEYKLGRLVLKDKIKDLFPL